MHKSIGAGDPNFWGESYDVCRALFGPSPSANPVGNEEETLDNPGWLLINLFEDAYVYGQPIHSF